MNKNFTVTQRISKYIYYLLFIIWSCSDKYQSLTTKTSEALSEEIRTDKDSMVIRVKDYSNYSSGGFLSLWAVNSYFSVISWQFKDSSGHLKVFYDSTLVSAPVAINQPTIIYVACDDTGHYNLTIMLTDKTEIKGIKNIPVHVVINQPPIAIMTLTTIDSSGGYKKIIVDGSNSYEPLGKIIQYLFYVDGAEAVSINSSEIIVLYSGVHTVGIKVVDDLGVVSAMNKQTILVQ